MENFSVGEIVWAKIRGYPWWPAMITGTVDENKEKKYVVGFIGDNTHSILQKQKLAKFQKEYKTFANTKKKILLESIRLAKEMIENKGKAEEFERLRRTSEDKISGNNIISQSSSREGKGKIRTREMREVQECIINCYKFIADSEEESDISDEEEEKVTTKKNLQNKNNKKTDKTNGLSSNLNNDQKDFTKLKRRRPEERKENQSEVNDLMKRIINYLLFVSKNIDNNFNWECNKELLLKVFDYLKDYKINNPIDFLKKTSLGIMIKYINGKVEDKDIQESSNSVYKNFEDQVLDQLFKNTNNK